MIDLSAITLTAPWAQLCVAPLLRSRMATSPYFDACAPATPLKQHETRGYRLTDTPRRLVIHSGKGDGGMRRSITEGTCAQIDGQEVSHFVDPYAAALRATGYSTLDPWQMHYEKFLQRLGPEDGKQLMLGYVVGLVTVTKMVATGVGQPAHDMDRALGNWKPNRWAWKLEEPFMLERPFHARGFQSLWKVADYQQAMIREQGGTW